MPCIVGAGIWACESLRGTAFNFSWDGLGLSTRVVSTADRDNIAEGVLDGNATSASNAKGAVGWVGELKLAICVAVKATNGLSRVALSSWPL